MAFAKSKVLALANSRSVNAKCDGHERYIDSKLNTESWVKKNITIGMNRRATIHIRVCDFMNEEEKKELVRRYRLAGWSNAFFKHGLTPFDHVLVLS